MSKIKFVFIDIDDTLFDFKRSEALSIRETLKALSIMPTDETVALYSKINKSLWEALERGEIERERLLTRRYELLFEALGVTRDAKEAQSIYEAKLSASYFYLDGAVELLSSLSGKYKVYLASNGTAKVQDGRIAISGISKYADGIFISERIGHNKPSREFFDACFASIDGFSRDGAIMIGDSLTSDILGGKNAGILTCLFNPLKKPCDGKIKADFEVGSLSEILPLLERL
jgi:2-haloacid dehalogenase